MKHNFTSTDLKYYRQRKIPRLLDVKIDNEKISIHEVINSKVNYDPFEMRKKGTVKHNKMNLLRSKYNRYLKGGFLAPTRDEFKHFLLLNFEKYLKHFK